MEARVCNGCGKVERNTNVLHRDNWLSIQGGPNLGIKIWYIRESNHSIEEGMVKIGQENYLYDFCSIDCLTATLKRVLSEKKSI